MLLSPNLESEGAPQKRGHNLEVIVILMSKSALSLL